MNATELGAQPAMISFVTRRGFANHYEGQSIEGGLTKRELFAAMAMQGILGNEIVARAAFEKAMQGSVGLTMGEAICSGAVGYADALLAELAKEQP